MLTKYTGSQRTKKHIAGSTQARGAKREMTETLMSVEALGLSMFLSMEGGGVKHSLVLYTTRDTGWVTGGPRLNCYSSQM